MFLLIGALALGFIVARYNLLPQFLEGKMAKVGSLALFLLLFSMGISIGVNPDIISTLPSLGWKALVLSMGSIVGSVFLVWLAVWASAHKSHRKSIKRLEL